MFLKLLPKNMSADTEHEWRVKKNRMEMATGATVTDLGWSQRSLQLRECALRVGRPQLIMKKMWQMMQSKDTKNLNLDKDFEEIVSEVKQVGWNESTRTKRFWRQDEDEDQ